MSSMQKSLFVCLTVLAVATAFTPVRAEDVSGKWGVSAIAQAGFPLGQKAVRDQVDDVGPLLGAMVRYGLTSHLGVGLSYENLEANNGLRVEPITLQAIYNLCPQSRWSPVMSLGLGASRGVDVKNFNHIAAKAAAGIDYFVTPSVAVGPQLTYHYVSDKDDSINHLHALSAGLIATYYFGSPAAAPAVARTPEPAKPAPVAKEIALTLTPSEVALGPSQTKSFSADVANAKNRNVTWSYSPKLGTLSDAGLYTAPEKIALAETVTVTATSQEDGTKSASSIVKLIPPVNAKQSVSIELKVLFDTNKDIVKPEYDAEIKQVAEFMKNYPSSKAEIEGHTDSMGDKEMNMGLSQRRADAVRNYLIKTYGVDASRLTAKGYGPTQPVADNKTKEGRAKNRRVVATFTGNK